VLIPTRIGGNPKDMSTDDDGAPAKPERERPRTEPAREAAREERRDDDDGHDGLPETLRRRLESLVPELVKKTFQAGMGAVFSTEEGIRRLARENLPEVAGYIASSADGAKDKVFEVIARETREFLGTLNLTEEIAKILTTLSFEIKTEIRFIPNSERMTGAEPDVKASVRLKRNDQSMKADKADKADKAEKDADADRPDKEDGAGRDSRSRLRFWRRDGGSDGDGGDTGDK